MPSYTDRVFFEILSYFEDPRYYSVDQPINSDHRPVCLDIRIFIPNFDEKNFG